MKIVPARNNQESDSSESYGHEFRLRYRKEYNCWNG